MIAAPIHADCVSALPSTFIHLRLTDAAVLLVTTKGIMHVGCDHPRYLLRDIQAGAVTDFQSGTRLGSEPFTYVVESATMSNRRETPSGQSVLPENMPLPEGIIVLETPAKADYHDFDAIQIVGVTRHRRLVLGFVATSYQVVFPAGVNPVQLYREAIKGEMLTEHNAHFSTLPSLAFLNWCPARRIHCEEILEVQHTPESWGSTIEILSDFRAEPSHAQFQARVPGGPAKGIDI